MSLLKALSIGMTLGWIQGCTVNETQTDGTLEPLSTDHQQTQASDSFTEIEEDTPAAREGKINENPGFSRQTSSFSTDQQQLIRQGLAQIVFGFQFSGIRNCAGGGTVEIIFTGDDSAYVIDYIMESCNVGGAIFTGSVLMDSPVREDFRFSGNFRVEGAFQKHCVVDAQMQGEQAWGSICGIDHDGFWPPDKPENEDLGE